jgi:hypothetical protein
MMFCLDDGAELLYGPASMEEPATAILSEPGSYSPPVLGGVADGWGGPATGFPAGESPTRSEIYTTDQTAIFPAGREAEPQSKSLFAHRAAKPLLAGLIATVLLFSGFFGYRYFNAADAEQIDSIAVLPFENRSGSSDTEYLSDGLADSLI